MTKFNRRRFLGVVTSASVVGLAGCAADDDSDSDDEAEPEDDGDDETESQPEEDEADTCETVGDCTQEFAELVASEIAESGDTPEPIDTGYVVDTEIDEEQPENAFLSAAFDLTNENTFGTQIGNMVFGPIFENWPDYPDTERFYIQVYPTTDGDDWRTDLYVEEWWLQGVRDEEFTTDEVGEMIVDTSTEPLNQVLD